MPVEDQRFLGNLERSCIHLNLRRGGESFDTVLAVDAAKGSFQGGRTRGPQQPVRLVHRAEDAIEVKRPALSRLGTIFS